MCSYGNCLYPNNDLETCGTSNCYKKLHHFCQTNIDEAQFNGKFEDLFGLRFACYDCMAGLMKKGLFPSSEDNTESESDEEGDSEFECVSGGEDNSKCESVEENDSECVSDEEKDFVVNDDLSDIIINEQSDVTKDNEKNDDNSILSSSDASENDNEEMKSGKNDENSSDESSDELDNDIEEMKFGLSAIYEAYFWKSFNESINKEIEIPIQTLVNMTSYWKGIQYITHANNIKTDTLELIKDQFLQFSQWKNKSISNVMRENYKVGNNGIKKEVVNNIYKLMILSDNRKVFFINKNHTVTVMNEKDIKTSIRMFFRPSYDVNISGIEEFNTSMTKVKTSVLVNNVHKSCYEHIVEKNGSNYDMSLSYHLFNHVKVHFPKSTSKKSKSSPSTSSTTNFH